MLSLYQLVLKKDIPRHLDVSPKSSFLYLALKLLDLFSLVLPLVNYSDFTASIFEGGGPLAVEGVLPFILIPFLRISFREAANFLRISFREAVNFFRIFFRVRVRANCMYACMFVLL